MDEILDNVFDNKEETFKSILEEIFSLDENTLDKTAPIENNNSLLAGNDNFVSIENNKFSIKDNEILLHGDNNSIVENGDTVAEENDSVLFSKETKSFNGDLQVNSLEPLPMYKIDKGFIADDLTDNNGMNDGLIQKDNTDNHDQISNIENLSPEELKKAVQEESEKIEETLTDEEFQSLIESFTTNKSADELIKQSEEDKKAKIRAMALPDGYVNSYENEFATLPKLPDISDALVMCLEDLGVVDIEYISARTGASLREVIYYLVDKKAIYQNPKTWGKVFYKGWETADEYLSGNLFVKFNQAKAEAKEYPEFFEKNITAIESLFPDKVLGENIYATIGSPWIPARYYNEFLSKYLKIKRISNGVVYDTVLKKWKVNYSTKDINSRYDVQGMTAVEIFERTLNNRPIKITDRKYIDGKFVWVVNKSRTLAGMERQKEMIRDFRNWIFAEDDRKTTLENIYFERYGSVTARKFDGSFLKLDGINPVVSLHPHQRSAIARIMLSNSCLLSHSVGTGKTYIMISAGMEMRRIGTSTKNMYVVPNAIIEQWKNDFLFLYPNANIIVVDHRNMTPAKRETTLQKLRDGDFDAIIIAYSSFKMIPVSLKFKLRELENKFHEIDALNNNRYRNILQGLSEEIAELREQIRQEKLLEKKQIFFEELKITSLFVDEAHNFKNITIPSESEVLGTFRTPSMQADDLHTKIKLIRQRKAKSIVFATGTPITNSITDLFTMQTFLQPNELKFLGIDSFDQWALMFGEKTENFEMDVDSCNYRVVERFNQFHNLPELSNIFSGVADFHVEDDDSLFWDIKRNTRVVPRSTEQTEYIQTLVERTEKLRTKGGEKDKGDNLLKVTNDGRRMALDIRLVDPTKTPTQKTKIDACAEEVYRIYSTDPDVTQLVFCDISTPSDSFNVYDQLAKQLTELGVPRYEIAFIHDGGNNAKKRQAIVDHLNEGAYRVLVGSTPMLGTGVNVQKRLFAVHHLDVPWRPSDMIQREGRMIRQGNTNNVVEIYRYVTEGSFDSYSWQLLESKQRFISQLLSSSLDKRDGDEVDSIVLQYAEIKALAIGDPKIKYRVETYNELSRLKLLKMHNITRRNSVESNLEAYQQNLKLAIEQQKRLEKDFKTYNHNKQGHIPLKELGELISSECNKDVVRTEPVTVAKYCGFDIIVPTSCTAENPMFYLIGQYEKIFRFYNEKGLKMNDLEVAKQVERYLSTLPDVIKNVNKKKIQLNRNIEQAIQELNTDDNLDAQIAELTEVLNDLDEELGVNEDE